MAPAAARVNDHFGDGADLDRALWLRKELDIDAARKDPCAFIEWAIPHEKTGAAITCQPFHREWQQVLTDHTNAVIMAPIEHGKTQQAIGRLLWEIGRDPSMRCAIVSNTARQAEKILGAVAQHITNNPAVREVFPGMRPASRGKASWNIASLEVERPTIAKDPTLQAVGVAGPVMGSRLELAILDDILDFENTRTAVQREKIMEWFETTLARRMVEGGRIWVIGTPWTDNDFLHEIGKRPGFELRRYSAVENPDDPQEKWRPIWHSLERLRDAAANTSPHNFSRKYLCRVTSDEVSRFQRSWIDLALALGKGRKLIDRAPITPGGKRLKCFTGVDVGIGQKQENDLTVLFTIAVDERERRIPVDIQSGRWQGPEILNRIQHVAHRYDSMVTLENNGAQEFLRQFGALQNIVTRAHTTGKNKFDEAFGVESLAVEFRAGLWLVPSGATGGDIHPELQQWIAELLGYHPERHAGDRLMASWIAREAARQTGAGIFQRIPDPRRR